MRRACVIALALAPLAGCAEPRYPARGTVALDDGTRVIKGVVVFERLEGGSAVTARGEIKPDGGFELTTDKPGDGVPAGRYRVLINPLDLSDVPDEEKPLPYDAKYLKFQTSGLTAEVKAGPNEVPLKLARPAPRPDPKPADPKPEPPADPKKPDGGPPK
jgi:hypothetical protein